MAGEGKIALLLATAVLLAAALAACGGATETSRSTDSAAQPPAADPTGSAKSDTEDSSDQRTGGGEETKGGSGSATEGDGADDGGEDSSRSRQFVVPGGDNSIPNFGDEANASEREQASAELERYLRARAVGDSRSACASLSREAVAQVEELAATLRNADSPSCVSVLNAVDERTQASERANTIAGSIVSLRVDGDRAFALYHGTDGADYTIQMSREGGRWKVAALLPFALS